MVVPKLAGECTWEVRNGEGLVLLVRWYVAGAVWHAVYVIWLQWVMGVVGCGCTFAPVTYSVGACAEWVRGEGVVCG